MYVSKIFVFQFLPPVDRNFGKYRRGKNWVELGWSILRSSDKLWAAPPNFIPPVYAPMVTLLYVTLLLDKLQAFV